ncbi:hypothetical protein FGO68_gene501 [Halteria grandinella]|uniref:Uncharacterized protein n=1 Tax=Halteria grandinella TaxID=5974 RepID=A0A8J8SWP5_HALGN|nr:hypothetical protein FGO68_gene501 [Halteria grandinella]
MQDYTRVKNKELDVLRKERDFERGEKEKVMKGMEELVKNAEKREGMTLQKMSLLLNAKKGKIAELRGRIEDLQEAGVAAVPERKVSSQQKHPPPPQQQMMQQRQPVEDLDNLEALKSQHAEKTKEEKNRQVRENTLQFLQSQHSIKQYTGTTQSINTQHLKLLDHGSSSSDDEIEMKSEQSSKDMRYAKGSSQGRKKSGGGNQKKKEYKRESSLTDLFFS